MKSYGQIYHKINLLSKSKSNLSNAKELMKLKLSCGHITTANFLEYYIYLDFIHMQWLCETFKHNSISVILIHYVCNAHFHLLSRRKFAASKSWRLCHESSDDVRSLAILMRLSNITKTFWKCVLSEWIWMVITRFVFEWFAGINCIILRWQIPVLPFRWRVAVKLNLRPQKWYIQFMPANHVIPLVCGRAV